jgi:hypothetical protein
MVLSTLRPFSSAHRGSASQMRNDHASLAMSGKSLVGRQCIRTKGRESRSGARLRHTAARYGEMISRRSWPRWNAVEARNAAFAETGRDGADRRQIVRLMKWPRGASARSSRAWSSMMVRRSYLGPPCTRCPTAAIPASGYPTANSAARHQSRHRVHFQRECLIDQCRVDLSGPQPRPAADPIHLAPDERLEPLGPFEAKN